MNKIYSLTAFLTCAVLIFSSCSRLSTVSITKRHYRGGFYVDIGSPKSNSATAKVPETIAPITPLTASVNEAGKNEIVPEKKASASFIADKLIAAKTHNYKQPVEKVYA